MASDKTRIQRLPELAVEDLGQIESILDEGFICHVAYLMDDRPVVIPTLYARDGGRVLLHGSPASGLMLAVKRSSPRSMPDRPRAPSRTWAPGCGQESFPSSWPPGLRCPPRIWSRGSISRTI